FNEATQSLRSINKFCSLAGLCTFMLNYIYQYSDATHLVIMVNPKYASIFELIGFEQYSEIRHYDKVDKPVVPLVLDIETFMASANYNPASLFSQSVLISLERGHKYQFSASDLIW